MSLPVTQTFISLIVGVALLSRAITETTAAIVVVFSEMWLILPAKLISPTAGSTAVSLQALIIRDISMASLETRATGLTSPTVSLFPSHFRLNTVALLPINQLLI